MWLRIPTHQALNQFGTLDAKIIRLGLDMYLVAGGLPIVVDDEMIGSIGIGGSGGVKGPDGSNFGDEQIANYALTKVLGPQPPLTANQPADPLGQNAGGRGGAGGGAAPAGGGGGGRGGAGGGGRGGRGGAPASLNAPAYCSPANGSDSLKNPQLNTPVAALRFRCARAVVCFRRVSCCKQDRTDVQSREPGSSIDRITRVPCFRAAVPTSKCARTSSPHSKKYDIRETTKND